MRLFFQKHGNSYSMRNYALYAAQYHNAITTIMNIMNQFVDDVNQYSLISAIHRNSSFTARLSVVSPEKNHYRGQILWLVDTSHLPWYREIRFGSAGLAYGRNKQYQYFKSSQDPVAPEEDIQNRYRQAFKSG